MGHAENAAAAAAGKLARAPIKKQFGNEIVCYNRNAAEDHDSAAFFLYVHGPVKKYTIYIIRKV